jgi:hypothetical protein
VDGPQHIGAEFLAQVFGPTTTAGAVFVCSLLNDGAGGERFVTTRDQGEITAFARAWDQPERGLYYCVSTVQPNARRRAKDTLAEIAAFLHADLDFKSIDASPDETRRALRELMCPPSIVIASGHGLHALWLLKEALEATPENIAEVERLLKLLTEYLSADPKAAQCANLLRLPGTHNTKRGEWVEVAVEVNGPERRYDLDEMRDWLELVPAPRLRRVSGEGKANGGDRDNPFIVAGRGAKPPIDAAARLAAMRYQGPGEASIHNTQLAVSASLLMRGVPTDEVVATLLAATRIAAGNDGLTWNWDREERDLRKMCVTWLGKHPRPEPEPTPASTQPSTLFWHGETPVTDARSWLVADVLPEIGKGLISGQWGSYKTFGLLDLAGAVMSGGEFAGHPVVRRGGVLLFAAEGLSEVGPRLRATLTKYAAAQHPELGRAPFAWTAACPRLLERDAADKLIALAREADERMQRDFGLPLALIAIDTLTAAAGYEAVGEENDAALGARILNTFERVAQATRALVLAVGHFGKKAETGTRGTGTKEDFADAVLAFLADKSIGGEVTNPRMALRKLRSGRQGQEFPFRVREVELGVNSHGMRETSLIIDWGADPEARAQREAGVWPRHLRLLQRVLAKALTEHGTKVSELTSWRVVDVERVREEFYAVYPADGDTPAAKQAARQKAFRRALEGAQGRGLLDVREVGATIYVWPTAEGGAK